MSSPRKTNVPAIPAIGRSPQEVDAVLKAVKEAVEIGHGRRGDPVDRFVTLRDLGDAGIATLSIGRGGVTISAPAGPGDGAPIFDPGAPDFGENDFTVPPAPTGVAARGVGPDSIMVTWNPPDYSNHEYAEVFCVVQAQLNQTPTFNLAAAGFVPNKPVGTTNVHPNFAGPAAGTIFTHRDLARITLPGQDPLDAALTPPLRYYFVRFVSTAGVPGPYAPLNGAAGRMVIDERATLTAMIGNVTGSAAYANLLRGYLNTTAFDPVLAAGGVQPYIQQQDVATKNTINAQLVRLIGVSDQAAGSQTLIQRIDTTSGVANAAAASVSNLQLWQAALSRAGTGQGSAGAGQNAFTDFVAAVYRNVFVSVDENSALAQAIDVVDARIGPAGAFPGSSVWATTQTLSQADVNINGELNNLWSVRMAQDDGTGMRRMAGFGLSLERTAQDDGTFRSLSTFLVNANQFAVMGAANKSGALITNFSTSGSSSSATFTLRTTAHGFVTTPLPPAGELPSAAAVLSVPDVGPRAVDGGSAQANPLAGMAGAECVVTSVSGANVTVRRIDNGSFGPARNIAIDTTFGNALMSAMNIPFIIDTERSVVGIRGRLVVDGLIRATNADFDTLSADTGFIRHLQAEVVNANVVVGQRIIAGAPGKGSLTAAQYATISNFIIELNNPVTSQYPLRFWKPTTGQMNFGLDQAGNIFIGGNMSVGGNATIATSGANLLSAGGAGQDGSYALWIGPRSGYGVNGNGRTEANGMLWAKDDGRAGINADLFLGNNAFDLPFVATSNGPGAAWYQTANSIRASGYYDVAVSTSPIVIRARRDGGAPTVMMFVQALLCAVQGAPGNDEDKMFELTADLIGSNSAGAASIATIQKLLYDDVFQESLPVTVIGAVNVPAGSYYVRLRYKWFDGRGMAICNGWTSFGMVMQSGGGIVGGATVSNPPPAEPTPVPPPGWTPPPVITPPGPGGGGEGPGQDPR